MRLTGRASILWAAGLLAACNGSGLDPASPTDMSVAVAPPEDLSWQEQIDWGGMGCTGPDICGDDCEDPGCIDSSYGPPSYFPLQSDPMRDPDERDSGLLRDPNGYL